MAGLVVLCAIAGAAGVAHAGRKRVVVLDFEGPKGDKFHEDLVRLIKKTHTVVPTDKWNGTAEELGAGGGSDGDLKKVAKKLKIDAIVEGKIEKRRDSFILHLKLHEGKSGAVLGSAIDTKADGPRIDGKAQRDLKDELVDAIDSVDSNRPTGDDDSEDRPAKKASKKASDDDDDKPVKKAAKKASDDEDEDEDRPRKFSKRSDDERGSDRTAKKTAKKADDDEDKLPAKKTTAAKKADDDEDKLPARKTAAAKKADDDEDKLPARKTTAAKKADDDEDKLPARRTAAAKKSDDDEDKLPAKKTAAAKKADDDKLAASKKAAKPADDDKVASKKAAKPADDEDKLPPRRPAPRSSDDDKLPARKVAKKSDDGAPRKKVVASRDDEDAEVEATPSRSRDAGMALSPGERALDAVVGMSLSVRRLAFNSRADLPLKPPGYKGSLVPGAMFDVTAYPLAFAHDRKDMLKNLGLRVAYDRVLLINTKDKLGVTYATAESRWAIDAVFRYPFGKAATAPVAVGSLGYSSQKFTISAGGGMLDFPNVQYSIIEPGVGLRLPVGKLVINADAKLMVITNTGQIQDPAQYGAASVFGFEGAAGADYAITPNIFARAAFRFETIGFTFKGAGAMTTMRDGDGATVDVTGARDTYFGGLVTVGYLY